MCQPHPRRHLYLDIKQVGLIPGSDSSGSPCGSRAAVADGRPLTDKLSLKYFRAQVSMMIVPPTPSVLWLMTHE